MFRSMLLVLSGVAALYNNTIAVSDCDTASILKITALSFSPDAPIPGQNGTLFTHYDVPYEITKGIAKYTCTLNGIPVLSETHDLCAETACPITIGHHDDTSESAVPVVSGTLTCKIKWEDEAARPLLCIQTKMILS
jgi:ML domain